MPAEQKLNQDIWDFWTRTQKAWSMGVLDDLGTAYKSAANSVMTVEQFADTTPAVVKALKQLRPDLNEYFVGWADDADFILTNKRYMIRRCKGGDHDIYNISDIRGYSQSGWWTASVIITTKDGRSVTYRELTSVVKPEIMNKLLAGSFNMPSMNESVARPTVTETHSIIEQNETQNEEDDMSDQEMIGAEYPELQQIIKNHLQAGEELVAFTTASRKIGGSGAAWIPFVGTTLELARSLTTKPILLAVTDKRFMIIQLKAFSKNPIEVAFDEVPLKLIRTAAAAKHFSFIYSKLDGESLKLEVGDGRKYTFRNITSENAQMIRDAILGN